MTYSLAAAARDERAPGAGQTRSTKLRGPWLWLARSVWLATLLFVVAVLVALVPINYWTTWGEWQVGQARPAVRGVLYFGDFVRLLTWVELAGAAIALLVALLLAWKRSDDRMGLFVSATLLLMAPMQISSNVDFWRMPYWLSPLAPLVETMPALTLAAVVLLFYLFPDGHFVPGWMRVPALVAFAVFVSLWLYGYLQDIGILPVQDFGWMAWVVTLTISILVATSAQVYRYRRVADVVQRQQMKWVLLGLGCLPLWVFLGVLGSFLNVGPWYALLQLLVNYLAFVLIPLTIGLSMLRFRLWDIDLVLNRTLVYSGLTLLVLALYGLVVGGMAFLLQTRVGPGLAVLATAVVALLALPLRQRLQRTVNHLMYGERDEPMEVLTRLGQSLEAAGAPDTVLPALAAAIAEALRLPYVAIALQREGEISTVAAYPDTTFSSEPAAGLTRLPLAYQGETVGQLIVAARAPGERFTPADERLLQDIARQAGAAAHAVRLTSDLQRSRERLVTTREEERRRLRHNLHDDLGPRLATLTLKLDATRNLLQTDPAAVEAMLSQLKGDVQTAIAEVRHLVYDLRPPALDQLGLVPALRQYAAQVSSGGLHVRIQAPTVLPVLPAAVEVAAYRIATEALTNVIRHARAGVCLLSLGLVTGALVVEVRDDGRGLAEGYQAGVGMASMRERAEELGGICVISPAPEGGVRVSASLPLAP